MGAPSKPVRVDQKMPYILPILTGAKQSQYIPILSGLAGRPITIYSNTYCNSHPPRWPALPVHGPIFSTNCKLACCMLTSTAPQSSHKYTEMPHNRSVFAHISSKALKNRSRWIAKRFWTLFCLGFRCRMVFSEINNPIYFQYLVGFSSIINNNT